jgi:hypothetical protein
MRPPPLSDAVRHNIVRRLGFIFAASILVQLGAYMGFVYCITAASALAPAVANVAVSIAVLVLRIAVTLPLGYFGARFTIREMRRAAPPAARMAVQPAIIASGVAACIVILANVSTAPATWLTILRDVLAAGIWIFAARRSLRRTA